jgi:hypothetical protein
VPFDQVFYRLLPEEIDGRRIEPLGFGISGWGTLHSLLAYEVKAPRYDLDVAVYVFVENDLGDNAIEVKGVHGTASNATFAKLSPFQPGFEIVQRIPFEQQELPIRTAKWVQQRSLLARVVWSRYALLIAHGAVPRETREQIEMTTRADRIPNQNDLPSSWPEAHRRNAQELGRRILSVWRARTQRDGCHLVVLYVPRGESQLRGELPLSDTWLPWLEATTRELGIPLLDPSDALKRRLEQGDGVYDDHWSPPGHEVIADVLREYLARYLRDGRRVERQLP